MEKQPPQHETAERARTKRLLRHIRRLEGHLRAHWSDTSKTNKLLGYVADDIGYDMVNQKAHLLAVGYTYDPSGYLDPVPHVIETDEAYYKGVIIQEVDDNDRVMMQYEVGDPADETTMWPYCIPPRAVVYSERDILQTNCIAEYIANNRILANQMFQKTNFFNLNPEQQHMLLRKHVAEELIADISLDYSDDVPVTIGSDGYYQMNYDDSETADWHEHPKSGTVEGVVIQAVYLESLQNAQAHFKDKGDFIYGNGLPCLVVSNDQQETVSFVPVDSITTFFGTEDSVQ